MKQQINSEWSGGVVGLPRGKKRQEDGERCHNRGCNDSGGGVSNGYNP